MLVVKATVAIPFESVALPAGSVPPLPVLLQATATPDVETAFP